MTTKVTVKTEDPKSAIGAGLVNIKDGKTVVPFRRIHAGKEMEFTISEGVRLEVLQVSAD